MDLNRLKSLPLFESVSCTAEVRRGDRILAELGPGDFFGEKRRGT